jgi:hypothetical protein
VSCTYCGESVGLSHLRMCEECAAGEAAFCACGATLQRGNYGVCDDCHTAASGDLEAMEADA